MEKNNQKAVSVEITDTHQNSERNRLLAYLQGIKKIEMRTMMQMGTEMKGGAKA